jgi:molecular chaperone DnaJ
MNDLYQVLGISKSATADEIKKAYRNLAFKYHPDRNPGDKAAEDKFKQINEAYSVLGDETKRSQYDRYGSAENYSGQQAAQNPYGHNGYGSYQNSGEDFWDWFANGSQNTDKRYTYSWSSEHKSHRSPTKGESWSMLIQKGLLFLAGIFFLQYSFIIIPFGPFLCIAAIINGATGVAKAFRYIFEKKQNK